ncbi:MAK10-like protein [Tanacetum coccineum]
MRLRLFQFSLRDQASNWLKSLSARSITTWEDLTTHFLAQLFPPRRTAKLHTDILMFQKHQGESLLTRFTLKNNDPEACGSLGVDFLNFEMIEDDWRLESKEVSFLGRGLNSSVMPKEVEKDLHLNLPVLEVLAHAPVYNTMLDKYAKSLELGKNRSTFVQGEVSAKMEDPRLFTLSCILGDLKPFDTLADLGSHVNIIPLYLFKKLNIGLLEETDHIFGLADGTKSYPVEIVKDAKVRIGKLKLLNNFYVIDMKKDLETPLLVGRGFLATANAVIDYRKAKIVVGEGITSSVFGVKGVDLNCHFPGEWEITRDVEINPFKDVLVFRRIVEFLGALPINLKRNMWESEDLIDNPINWDKPPEDGDGAWHAKIRIINPDGEEFTQTLQSIPTMRKLSEIESPREFINLDHFYDT